MSDSRFCLRPGRFSDRSPLAVPCIVNSCWSESLLSFDQIASGKASKVDMIFRRENCRGLASLSQATTFLHEGRPVYLPESNSKGARRCRQLKKVPTAS